MTNARRIAMTVGNDMTRDHRVEREARSLAEAGYAVTVHAVLSDATSADEERHGFRIVRTRLPAWNDRGDGLPGAWRVARWWTRFAPLAAAAAASRPDVLHAHDLDTAAVAAPAARRLGVPLVYDDHEGSQADKIVNWTPPDARGAKRAVLDAAARWLRRRGHALERGLRAGDVAAIVTVSETLADSLVERYGGPRPVVVRNCPPWRAVERTDALREEIGAAPDDRLLIYHGTVTAGCGVETAIRALRELGPGHVLTVLGWAWRQELLEDVARAAGVADRVRFVPGVPQDRMFELVAGADVALIPTEPNTIGNRLGIPNKLFESLVAGVPVVATDVPEVGAILRRSGAGVVYPARMEQDPAELAAAVRAVLDDGAAAEAMRGKARAAARDELNWETESAKLVDLHARLATH